jgi:hypothetical protein
MFYEPSQRNSTSATLVKNIYGENEEQGPEKQGKKNGRLSM